MKIAIYLDEVLGYFLPAVIEFHNATYGTKLKIEQFHSYDFWEVWGGTKEQAIQKIYDFFKTPYFKNIKPVKGAQKAIETLKKDNDLYIVTSRQDDIIKETKEWVERYFPNTFSGIYFTNSYSQSGIPRTKSGVCDNLDIDILIEDLPKYVLQCFKPTRKIFIFDYPWNKDTVLPKEIQRVYSWEEVVSAIKKLKK